MGKNWKPPEFRCTRVSNERNHETTRCTNVLFAIVKYIKCHMILLVVPWNRCFAIRLNPRGWNNQLRSGFEQRSDASTLRSPLYHTASSRVNNPPRGANKTLPWQPFNLCLAACDPSDAIIPTRHVDREYRFDNRETPPP